MPIRAHFIAAVATLLVAASTWTPSVVSAARLLTPRVGGDTAHAAHASPSAIFYNPASIGLLDKDNALYVDFALVSQGASYTQAQGENTHLTFDAMPAFGFIRRLSNTGLTLGVGLHVPFSSRSIWNTPQGEERWDDIFSDLSTYTLSSALSFKLMSGLHLGGTLHFMHATARSYHAIDLAHYMADSGERTTGERAVENEGRSLMEARGNAFFWTLGLTYKVDPTWTLGFSYTTPIEVSLPATLTLFTPRNNYKEAYDNNALETKADYNTTLPGVLRLGAEWTPNLKWSYRGSIEYVQWSQHKDVVLDVRKDSLRGLNNLDEIRVRSWQDAVRVRIGGTHTLDETLRFFGGIEFESNAIPDAQLTPDTFDALKFGVSAGVSFQLATNLDLEASYNHSVLWPRSTNQGDFGLGIGILNTNLTWRFGNPVEVIIPKPPPEELE